MIYLITDTHLGHRNMIKNCGRPERFTDIIFDNCRKIVKRDDLLIHLGDVAWNEANLQRFLKLPGRKILVRGNHDKKSTPYYLDAGFTLVVDQMVMTLQGGHILFSHAPQYAIRQISTSMDISMIFTAKMFSTVIGLWPSSIWDISRCHWMIILSVCCRAG